MRILIAAILLTVCAPALAQDRGVLRDNRGVRVGTYETTPGHGRICLTTDELAAESRFSSA